MEYNIGDKVEITSNHHKGCTYHYLVIGSIATIVGNSHSDGCWELEGENVNHKNSIIRQTVPERCFKSTQTNKMTTNQLMKDALKAQVDKLLKAQNTATTLEIKVELRKTDPEFYWDQATVSKMMDELAQAGTLFYVDNGTYRVYSDPNQTVPGTGASVASILQPQAASQTAAGITGTSPISTVTGTATLIGKSTNRKGIKSISKTKALELLETVGGRFVKVVFTKKKDGKERVMNCQIIKDGNGKVATPLGLVRVKESSLMKKLKKTGDINTIPSKSVIRSFNINNLKGMALKGDTFKVN